MAIMKLLSILILSLVLTGCGMSIEEYNARVKYCKDNGMDVLTYRYDNSGTVLTVKCQDSNGNTFESKKVK